MKDYIKQKFKKAQKYSLRGAATSQENVSAAKADFASLTPNYATNVLTSTAKLQALDLLSEGPIEGFFNINHEPCTVLEGTFIDNTPIVESANDSFMTGKFRSFDLKGMFVNYTTGVIDILNDYQGELERRYPDKRRIRSPGSILPIINTSTTAPFGASNGNPGFRGAAIDLKQSLTKAISADSNEDHDFAITYAINPARDTSKNVVTDLGLGVAGGIFRDSGNGYVQSPSVQQNYYGQDQLVSNLGIGVEGTLGSNSRNHFVIPRYNIVDITRPKKYQGSAVFTAGLSTGGSIQTSFCKRAFWKVLNGYHKVPVGDIDTAFNDTVDDYIQNYASKIMYSGSRWGTDFIKSNNSSNTAHTPTTIVSGVRPYDIINEFAPGSEMPKGIKEPIINAIQNKIKELPEQGWMYLDKHGLNAARFGLNVTPNVLHDDAGTNRQEAKGWRYISAVSDGATVKKNVLQLQSVNTSSTSYAVHASLDEMAFINRDDTSNAASSSDRYNSGFCKDRYEQFIQIDSTDLDATYTIQYDYLLPNNVNANSFRVKLYDANYHANFSPGLNRGFSPTNAEMVTGVWATHKKEGVSIATFTSVVESGIKAKNGEFTTRDRGISRTGVPLNFSLRFDFINGTDPEGSTNGDFSASSAGKQLQDDLYLANIKIKKENQPNSSVGSKTGYFIFNVQNMLQQDGLHRVFEKDYKLNFALESDVFNPKTQEALNYTFPEVHYQSGTFSTINESLCKEQKFNGASRDERSSQLWSISGASVGQSHLLELLPFKPFRFKGAALWPVYLGDTLSGMNGVEDGSFEKVFITGSDSNTVANNKLNSGIAHGYDVFSGLNDGICYVHVANPDIQIPHSDVTGKCLSLRREDRNLETFNYANISVYNNLGEEFQKPMITGSLAEHNVSKSLVGPFQSSPVGENFTGFNSGDPTGTQAVPTPNIVDDAYPKFTAFGKYDYSATGKDVMVKEGIYTEADAFFGNTGAISSPGNSSSHYEVTGVSQHSLLGLNNGVAGDEAANYGLKKQDLADYGDYFVPPRKDFDGISYTHTVNRREVEKIKATLRIAHLSSTHVFEADPLSPEVDHDKLPITFEFEIGFDGLKETQPPVKTRITYEGIVNEAYTVQTELLTLPSHKTLIDAFPNLTLDAIADKFKRYVTVRKLDFETNSSRIKRAGGLFSITEYLPQSFIYPNSALARVEIDARSFNSIPNRQYNVRLKKILVPSNYFPLDLLGKDRRFIEEAPASSSSLPQIYDGDWDGSFKLAWTDNPAWILYDLLINPRYGLGSRMDDIEDINIFNLYEIARHCDAVDTNGRFVGVPDGLGGLEPRFSCNIHFQSATPGLQAIEDIAKVFNGRLFWANGTIDFYSDRVSEPSSTFSNANVKDGIFNYQDVAKSANFNVAEVIFQDKKGHFKPSLEVVEDEDGIRKDGKLVRRVNGRGTTSRGQARRLAKYILHTNKLEREIIDFQVGLEALALNVGDIITVQDELKSFEFGGGLVLRKETDGGEKSLIVTQTFNAGSVQIGADGGAWVYAPSGQLSKQEIYKQVQDGQNVTEETLKNMNKPQSVKIPITQAVGDEDTNSIKLVLDQTSEYFEYYDLIPTGSPFNIETNAQKSQTFRVTEIMPSEQNLYSIRGTEYNSGKFNFIETDDEGYKLSEDTPFNIGIPEHEIKKPDQPISFSVTEERANSSALGLFDLEITIVFNPNKNIKKFEITVVQPNGKRYYKQVKASQDIINGDGTVSTKTKCTDIGIFGTFNVFVNSI